MYIVPLIVFVVLGLLAVAWNPIFALIVFAVFMVGYLGFVGFSRRTAQQPERAGREPGGSDSLTDDSETGIWGEERRS